MATLWITYAWADNQQKDVDFVAQELEAAGLTVKLDRWDIGAGKKLWEQIDNFITSPAECDAWLMFTTPHSLGSEPCKEEFTLALDRALNTRGATFPLIALAPGKVDPTILPGSIRTRLCVSLLDGDWKERVVAAAEGRRHVVTRPTVDPYHLHVHHRPDGEIAIEVRPRAGSWAPVILAVPHAEIQQVNPRRVIGPAGLAPDGGCVLNGTIEDQEGDWYFMKASNEATPTTSYFLLCKQLPSRLHFGIANSKVQYTHTF